MSWVTPDSEDMLAATAGLPEQLAEAATVARAVPGLPGAAGISSVVVAGMGGSGVAGEVLRGVGEPELAVPLVLVADYRLPAFVGSSTLVFAVSFSGETEEVLEVAESAASCGARLVAITGGGRLAGIVDEAGGAVFPVLPGIPEPRAGIGATVAPLLVACERLGLLGGVGHAIDAAVAQLQRRRDTLVAGGGVAADLARSIGRTIPLVQGAAGIGAVAARRWKTQVNENAKAPAFFSVQPEWCHNEVCGFGQSGDITRQVTTIVSLRTAFDHERSVLRSALVRELVGEAVAGILEVSAEGSGALAQLFDLVMIGDFVSLHLAAHDGIDPGPVPVLVEVKRRLAGS